MQKITDLVLVIGFLAVDALLFHDLFKTGERYTAVEYLVGALSVLVILNSLTSLLRGLGARASGAA